MLQLLKSHKKAVVIASAAVLLCAVVAATVIGNHIKPNEPEPIPPGRIHDAGILDDGGEITIHDSTEGEIVIAAGSAESGSGGESDPEAASNPAPLSTISDPEAIWTADAYAGNHTPVEKAQIADGSIGILTVPDLSLSVNVYESPDNLEAMSRGVAHFPTTSAYDGNVAFSAHNINLDGSDGYFKYLYTLEKGDSVTYQTALGERSYIVESVAAIAASDWTPLNYTDDNRLTMTTCISGQPDKRLCVTAIESAA